MDHPPLSQLTEFAAIAITLYPDPDPAEARFDEEVQLLREHPVYEWLEAQPGLHRAWEQVRRKAMLKRDLAAEIPEVYWQMHFRGAVAMHFRDYFADCESNSPHETVVRARDKQSAIKRIKSVQKLIIRGVGFTDNEKNQQLIALLQALGDELSAGRGPSRTNRKSKKFPINRLVVALAGHFRTCFDEDCPKAVAELIAIIDPEALSDRQLQRVITSSHEPNPKTDKS